MKHEINLNKTKTSRIADVDFEILPFGKVFTDHMFISDYKDGQWQDHRIVPLEPMTMHPANMTLHYGQAIFEGMKAGISEDGIPLLFRPDMHADRINASATRMSMPEIPKDLFVQAVKSMVSVEKEWIPRKLGSALYIRPFMIAMDDFVGVAQSASYRFIIITLPVGPYYNKPVKLLADEKYVRAAKGGTGEAKAAGNYAGSLLPARIAREKGFDQVLWLDARYRKFLQEVGTMNIFFVIGDKIITPLTDGAILKGITRDSIITILQEKGYQVDERPITIDELIDAYDQGILKEVFGTGTAAVVSVVSLIAYKERKIELDVTKFEVAPMVKEYMDLIRNGSIPDTHNWVVPVEYKIEVLV
jgi:branched-chain amino acid aminotransferase